MKKEETGKMNAFLMIFPYVVLFFIGGTLFWLLIVSLKTANPGITAAIIAGLFIFAGGVYTHNQTKNREIKARHFIEKKNAYMGFLDLIFDVLSATKNKKQIITDDKVRFS